MSQSPLATKWWPASSSNYTAGRQGSGIWGIIIHHAASTSLDSVGYTFANAGRQASAHYGVKGKQIHQYVAEENAAWHAGDYWGNMGSIGIETVNSTGSPSWLVDDETFSTLVKLVADIAKRNGLGKLKFEPDGYCPNLSAHRNWSATSCVPVDTEILTKNGWKTISEVEVGEDIATVHIDDLSIKFSPVENKVPEKTQDTWEIHDIEVTADHRMLWKTQHSNNFNRVNEFQDIPKNQAVYIPNAGFYNGQGLPLSNNEIKLLVAVQADGHYEKGGKSGKDRVTFHVSKERKIALLDEILAPYDHKKYQHADGTVSYNVKGIKDFCEEYLNDKMFSYKFFEMNNDQAKLFLDTILDFDGCRTGNDYSSTKKQNIDVVTAVASLNGIGTRKNGDNRVYFTKGYRSLDKREGVTRHQGTLVSCVTVASGFILIRQRGRTTVIGNCPGDYLYGRMNELAKRANEINYPTVQSISWARMGTPRVMVAKAGSQLVEIKTGKVVKTYPTDTDIEMYDRGTYNGKVYMRSKYSHDKGIENGIISDMVINKVVVKPEPEPEPEPEPKFDWRDLEAPLELFTNGSAQLIDLDTGKTKQVYSANTKIRLIQTMEYDGKTWYRTAYSADNNFNWAFEASMFVAPEPELPAPSPLDEPRDPQPDSSPSGSSLPSEENKNDTKTEEPQGGSELPNVNFIIAILQKIVEFVKHIINLITKKGK